jgi:hypothetical protein
LKNIGGHGVFNQPQNAILSRGSLFVADTGYNRVHIWKYVSDAVVGKAADVILSNNIWNVSGPDYPPLRLQNALFWPAGLAFDGSYLWVGEFKFGDRILRFSVN